MREGRRSERQRAWVTKREGRKRAWRRRRGKKEIEKIACHVGTQAQIGWCSICHISFSHSILEIYYPGSRLLALCNISWASSLPSGWLLGGDAIWPNCETSDPVSLATELGSSWYCPSVEMVGGSERKYSWIRIETRRETEIGVIADPSLGDFNHETGSEISKLTR